MLVVHSGTMKLGNSKTFKDNIKLTSRRFSSVTLDDKLPFGVY